MPAKKSAAKSGAKTVKKTADAHSSEDVRQRAEPEYGTPEQKEAAEGGFASQKDLIEEKDKPLTRKEQERLSSTFAARTRGTEGNPKKEDLRGDTSASPSDDAEDEEKADKAGEPAPDAKGAKGVDVKASEEGETDKQKEKAIEKDDKAFTEEAKEKGKEK